MAWGNSDAAWRQADTSTLGGKASNAGQAANTMFGSWIAPAANRQLREDAMALSEGTLGMTEAQKGSLASKEQALAGAQVAKQQEDINRKALASGGGFAGQYAEATQALGGEAAEAGARAYARADEVSLQLAEARRAEILGRMERQQDRNRENVKWGTEQAFAVVGDVFDMVLGGYGGVTSAGG